MNTTNTQVILEQVQDCITIPFELIDELKALYREMTGTTAEIIVGHSSRIINELSDLPADTTEISTNVLEIDALPTIYEYVRKSNKFWKNATYRGEIDNTLYNGILQVSYLENTVLVVVIDGEHFTISDLPQYVAITDMIREIGERETIEDLPGNGIFFTGSAKRSSTLSYTVKELPNTVEAIHEEKENILKDIDFFFNNIEIFSRFDKSPIRKTLLTGEPGTGKSTILANIAKKYSKEMSVIYIDRVSEIKRIITQISKNEPTKKVILIFEDCTDKQMLQGISTETLNIFDGTSLPPVTGGIYLLMSTNNPDRIDPRLAKRPGRIDKIFQIGASTGKTSIDIFMLYFKDLLEASEFDYTTDTAQKAIRLIAEGMTGAQIQELYQSYISYMVSQNKEFNIYEINVVKKNMFEGLKNIYAKTSFDYALFEKNYKELLEIKI